MTKTKGMRGLAWAPLVLAILIAAFAFYGPFDAFRLLWINTALYSSRFKFLATSLYPEDYIQSALEQGGFNSAPERKTDPSRINPAGGGGVAFAYVKGNHFKGCILKIDDPGRLALVLALDESGGFLEDMAALNNALGGVNASGYADDRKRGKLWGTTIVNGEIVSQCGRGERHCMGGFTRENKLVVGFFTDAELREQDYDWAFEFGPLLVVNGEKTELGQYSGGLSPRTAIGQRADGAVLLLVIDGRSLESIGATYQDVQTVLYANGAVNAIGLDGGSSSMMVYNGRLVSSPSGAKDEWLLPDAIVFR